MATPVEKPLYLSEREADLLLTPFDDLKAVHATREDFDLMDKLRTFQREFGGDEELAPPKPRPETPATEEALETGLERDTVLFARAIERVEQDLTVEPGDNLLSIAHTKMQGDMSNLTQELRKNERGPKAVMQLAVRLAAYCKHVAIEAHKEVQHAEVEAQ